ncbi:MAG: OsmC family protein [Chthoniobacterales bacterium]
MNAAEIRALQAPLKERYRETPEAARITLRAEGKVGEEMTCKVTTGKGLVEAGLHQATGGNGMDACSGDMLLESLVACSGVTLRAVAAAMEIAIGEGTITAEGALDFRGTLGVAKDVAVGFQAISLLFDLETNATEEQVATLLRLTQRYCVVFQTLNRALEIDVQHKIRRK